LDDEAIEELTELAQKALLRKEGRRLFVKRLGELVDIKLQVYLERAMLEEIDTAGVPFLFKPDLRGFNNVDLDREYQLSIPRRQQRAKRDKKPFKDINAFEWAIKPVPNGAADELTRLFGPRYRPLLRQFKHKGIIKTLSRGDMDHYDKFFDLGVTRYKSLAASNHTFGKLFEADHIFEQRFWNNNPNLKSSFDHKGEGWTFLVPKNHYIAAQLEADVVNKAHQIRYIHTEKTRFLRDLIPHGKERFYSIQQIWDAHLITFDAFGVKRSEYFYQLEDMFKIYVGDLKSSGTFNQGGKLVELPYIVGVYPTVENFFP